MLFSEATGVARYAGGAGPDLSSSVDKTPFIDAPSIPLKI